MENVWFSKTTWGCAKWICRGWERQIADKPRLYAVLVFGCLVFKEVLHDWQSLANGKDGGCHLFYLFSWPLVLFTRGCLPLSQQYPPLNRKPRSGFRFLISPEPVDVWPPLAKNARGLWGRDWSLLRNLIKSHAWAFDQKIATGSFNGNGLFSKEPLIRISWNLTKQ